jgi:hypothetical protein
MLIDLDVPLSTIPGRDQDWLRALFENSDNWALFQGLTVQVGADTVSFDGLLLNRFGEVFVLDGAALAAQAKAPYREPEALESAAKHVWSRACPTLSPSSVRVLQLVPPQGRQRSTKGILVTELGPWLERFVQARLAYERLHTLSAPVFQAIVEDIEALHVSAAATHEVPRPGDDYKAFYCAGCGTGVGAPMAHWCNKQSQLFGGKVYCAPCQGSVKGQEAR